jgi:MEMO1 family protein
MLKDEILKLARETVEEFVLKRKIKNEPEILSSELKNDKSGVFVTLKKDGELRGCIGTIRATKNNIAQEIISNAISAAEYDPRFNPVRAEELDQLKYSVDILSEEEEISSIDELDPFKYGVIVQEGYKRGLLLPNLEGIDTAEDQVNIAMKKAGIIGNKKVRLFRFEVVRYEEDIKRS